MAAAPISMVPPAVPPVGRPAVVTDYEEHIPLRFALNAGLRWVIRLREFIPFVPEPVVGGGAPSYFDASLWDLEPVVFRLTECGGLPDTASPGESCFKLRIFTRILRVLHKNNLSARSFASEEDFVSEAASCVEAMSDADRALFTITVLAPAPRSPSPADEPAEKRRKRASFSGSTLGVGSRFQG